MKTDKKIHRKPNNKTNVCTCAFYTPKKQEKGAASGDTTPKGHLIENGNCYCRVSFMAFSCCSSFISASSLSIQSKLPTNIMP